MTNRRGASHPWMIDEPILRLRRIGQLSNKIKINQNIQKEIR